LLPLQLLFKLQLYLRLLITNIYIDIKINIKLLYKFNFLMNLVINYFNRVGMGSIFSNRSFLNKTLKIETENRIAG
jgi:hypothetical protein